MSDPTALVAELRALPTMPGSWVDTVRNKAAALIAQQAASIVAATKERDELRDFGGSAVETAGRILEFLGIGQDASKEPGADRRRDRLAAWIDKAAEARAIAAEAERDRLAGLLDRLVNAKAISGVRDLVAGWNGENRPDGPYPRHDARLGATLPKANCGQIYELDDAMQAARAALSTAKERGE